jgi:isoleucyl-tRNA synthetase
MSAKFREYKGLDLTKVANETLIFWEENDIFQKSILHETGINHLSLMKGHLQQTVCQEYIT